MKEMIVGYRRQQREPAPIHIDGATVDRVKIFKLLSVHITEDLRRSLHTDSMVKKEQERLFNLSRLSIFGVLH
jgi:hypothetical protein